MAMLEINGRQVEVSDGFRSLSPEQQAAEVDEIADHLGIGARPGQPAKYVSAGKGMAVVGPSAQHGSAHEIDAPFTWAGAGKAVGGGLMKAAASVPGMPGDLAQLGDMAGSHALSFITGKPVEQIRAEHMAARQMVAEKTGIPNMPEPWDIISSQKVLGWMEPILGKPYQPQNTQEKYIDTVASFAPAALAPGSALQRAGQVVVPGMASEAAGQALEGSGFETGARIAGAVAGGGVTALTSRRGVPERMAGQAMGQLDDAALTAAGRLMLDAEQQGIPLTWPEAVQQITNSGTRLGDLQRVVENSEGGGAIMRNFYADRPQQIDAAARQQFDQIAPQPMAPERIGRRVQQAADADISGVNRTINNQTRPLYQAADQQQLPPNSPGLQDPAYLEAVRQIRSNPVLAPRFAHLPDNAVGMVDAAQKIMRSRAEALQVPGPGLNPYEASVTRQSRRQVTTEARNQSPEYDAAVQQQRQLRDQHLSPLQQGPTGRLAATSDVGAQTRGLFPNQPQARSEAGVARAMRGIGRTDPEAAQNIVRQHLETAFNEASQRTQAGQNPFGGAKFSAQVAGNPQQRANLYAAIRQIPQGHVLWRGFNRFLDILEATGKRPAPNSMTAFNAQLQKELERGGVTGEAATIAAAPQKAMTFISDAYKRFRLGRGTAQLAHLFTEGNLNDFRRLIQNGPGSPQAVASIVRLLSQVNAASNSSTAPAN